MPEATRALLASSSIFPFVRDGVLVDGVSCVDGGYRESICHTRLRREHPDAKLLLVLNDNERESIVRRMVVWAVLRLRDERLPAVWLDSLDRGPAGSFAASFQRIDNADSNAGAPRSRTAKAPSVPIVPVLRLGVLGCGRSTGPRPGSGRAQR